MDAPVSPPRNPKARLLGDDVPRAARLLLAALYAMRDSSRPSSRWAIFEAMQVPNAERSQADSSGAHHSRGSRR